MRVLSRRKRRANVSDTAAGAGTRSERIGSIGRAKALEQKGRDVAEAQANFGTGLASLWGMTPTTQIAHRQHGVVFIDHHEARFIFPDATEADGGHIIAHRIARTEDGHRHPLERNDLEAVAAQLTSMEEILIMGPGTAKHELKSFLAEHHPDVDKHVVLVMAAADATTGELRDIARTKFRHVDLWR